MPSPTGLVVELEAGWGGPAHELADAIRIWERGPEVAVGVLLSWLWFVEFEAEGVEKCRESMECNWIYDTVGSYRYVPH